MGKVGMYLILLGVLALGSLIFVFNPVFAQSGDDIAIGISGKDVNGVDGVGTVHVYDSEGTLLRVINNPDGEIHGQFGQTIDYVNGKIVISAPWLKTPDSKNIGSLYAFDGVDTAPLFTINNPDSSGPVEFGWSLVSSNNKIIASSPSQDINNLQGVGVVHVFDANSGNLIKTINNQNPRFADAFGNAVFSSDDRIMIGIPGKDAGNDETSGAVSIYDAETGSVLKTIDNPESGDSSLFGNSIATVNDKMIVSAIYKNVDNKQQAGAVYLFDISSGSLLKTIDNPDPDDYDFFGKRIVSVGNNFAVTAPNAGLYKSGKVFIFNGDTGSLIETIDSPQKIFRSGLGNSNEFGDALAYKDGILVIGDRGKIVDNVFNAGGVYVYDTDTWNLLQTIDNPDPVENDSFGNYVSFVGAVEPSQDDVSEITQKQESIPPVSNETKQIPKPEISNFTLGTVEWVDSTPYVGGYGVVKITDPDMNKNPDLVDIFTARAWSTTDNKGIDLDMVETNQDTGIFYIDIELSFKKSAIQILETSPGDVVTVSYLDLTTPDGKEIELTSTLDIDSQHIPSHKQLELGILPENIQCTDAMKLIFKNSDGSPACVTLPTYEKLLERGWNEF